MTTASAPAADATIASRSCSAEVTRMTLTPAGSASATLADTSVTSAPRAAAVLASAYPCLPEDQLPRNRTGSSSSLVPPAEITTRRPSRSGASPPAPRLSTRTAASNSSAGSGQRAGAGVRAGQPPGGGLKHQRAPVPQQRRAGLGGRVLPHLGVHGRRVQ